MRFVTRAFICTLLVVCCNNVLAAEAGTHWWQFGHHADASVSQPPTVATPDTLPRVNSQLSAPAPSTLSTGPIAHEVQFVA